MQYFALLVIAAAGVWVLIRSAEPEPEERPDWLARHYHRSRN